MLFKFSKTRIFVLIPGLVGLLFLGLNLYSQDTPSDLQVVFLDVGQGDAIFIRSPYGQKVLIDGGPNRAVLSQLNHYLPFYDQTIDLMVLTHPHADHVSGLLEVLRRYQVQKVLITGVVHTSQVYQDFLQSIQDLSIPLVVAQALPTGAPIGEHNFSAQQSIVLGDDLRLDVLWPADSLFGQSVENLNNSSIVLKLIYQHNSFLLTGDIEKEAEDQLLAYCDLENLDKCDVLRSDVLKIAHHGSDLSSQEEFLGLVAPKYAIISVGENNSYKHPSLRVINRLAALGAQIMRTDLEGNIICLSDGQDVECSH